MITIIGGGFSGLSAAYFLHRAGKDVTILEWSRGLGGRAATRNVGYRTMDSGAQRLDLSPLSSNELETQARTLLRAVAEERGVLGHLESFPGPVFRFDGRSISTAQQVDVPNWNYLDGGMKVLAEALAKDIPVRTHTRISDIVFETDHYTLRNQRGETMRSDGIVIALPAPYALALLQPHAGSNKKVKKITELLNEVNYEPMIGAIFGTTKINFKEPFSALFTDDVTAPIFWLSQESARRKLGVRRNEDAFVLQLGAEISRDYVLKTDKETFAAIERVFEEVLDVALPDVIYGEIQRWPAAFLSSSPFTVDTVKPSDFKVPLYLAGDYIAGQSSIASAFWSGKAIADKMLGFDAAQFIAEPARAQAQLSEEDWNAVVPPARAPRKPRPKLPRKVSKGKFDAKKGKRLPPTKGPKQPVQRGRFKPRPVGDRRQPAAQMMLPSGALMAMAVRLVHHGREVDRHVRVTRIEAARNWIGARLVAAEVIRNRAVVGHGPRVEEEAINAPEDISRVAVISNEAEATSSAAKVADTKARAAAVTSSVARVSAARAVDIKARAAVVTSKEARVGDTQARVAEVVAISNGVRVAAAADTVAVRKVAVDSVRLVEVVAADRAITISSNRRHPALVV